MALVVSLRFQSSHPRTLHDLATFGTATLVNLRSSGKDGACEIGGFIDGKPGAP